MIRKEVMNRRQFLKHTFLAGASATAVGAGSASAGVKFVNNTLGLRIGQKQYNLLFVLVDQWRFCAMSHGLHHDRLVRTPNLDKLAKQGVHWQRCYATHPVCTPNRSAILTGRWPWQTGMNNNDLMMPPEERCIAHEFTDAGYNCHYIGKWHMDGTAKPGFVSKGWRRRGFTTFEGFNRGHYYLDSRTFDNDGDRVDGLKGVYEPTYQTDLAIDFIKRNRNHPFFCFLSWGPPHTPYNDHLPEFSYDSADVVPRPNVPDNYISTAKGSLNDYFAHCTAMDHEIGRLMKTLDELDLADDTLVVFTADHGDMHRSHGMTYKSKPEEESWHVPLLMRLPGRIKGGQIATALISSADLMPTTIKLCGLKAPTTCTGKNKTGALNGGSMPDESVYGGIRGSWRAVAKGDFKLVIENVDQVESPVKLYDIKNDPYEMVNLINNNDYATEKASLLAEIEMWKTKTSDSFPVAPWTAKTSY